MIRLLTLAAAVAVLVGAADEVGDRGRTFLETERSLGALPEAAHSARERGSGPVALDDVVPFAWDRAIEVGPLEPPSRVAHRLGLNFAGADAWLAPKRLDRRTLLFVRGNEVVRARMHTTCLPASETFVVRRANAVVLPAPVGGRPGCYDIAASG